MNYLAIMFIIGRQRASAGLARGGRAACHKSKGLTARRGILIQETIYTLEKTGPAIVSAVRAVKEVYYRQHISQPLYLAIYQRIQFIAAA